MNTRAHRLALMLGALCPVAISTVATAQVQARLGGPGQSLMQRKVIVIGVDGMRPDAMMVADTPNLDGLIANGALSLECLAEDRTVSGPCWSTILCGVHRDKHGVSDNSFMGANYDEYPSMFRRLEETCDISTASIVNWAPINNFIVGPDADFIVTGVSDVLVASNAADLIVGGDPDVIFLHFDEVDGAGHANGFDVDVPGYLAEIEDTDALIGDVLDAIDQRRTAAREDWLIVITSDHGGTPDGRHGSNIPEHLKTPLIVSGLSADQGTMIVPQPTLADIPAIVFTFLDLPIDPDWNWDGIATGLDMPGSPSMAFRCDPPPPPPMGACCLLDGSCVTMSPDDCAAIRGTYWGDGTECTDAECVPMQLIFSENFDGVDLGPNVDEGLDADAVWTDQQPDAWDVDRSGVPDGGVTEWRGWAFTDPDWWTATAGDQNRSLYTKASGAIAVADPDEWDDLSHDAGTYNTSLITPPISLANAQTDTVRLVCDSSWRPEDFQRVRCYVTFDVGESITLFEWDSQPGDNFKPDAPNETLVIDIANPRSAQTMQIHFEMLDAGNDWWWALDNIEVYARPWGLTDDQLDDIDTSTFVEWHNAGDPRADIAEPFGVVDTRDLTKFLNRR